LTTRPKPRNSKHMKNYDIIYIPDPVLKQTAHQVDAIDDNIRAQMDGMLSAMYDAPGIGLAANQVGLLNRVLVMDLADKDKMKKQGIL